MSAIDDEASRFVMELLSEPTSAADDLRELGSSHFEAMRAEFNDLQPYDSQTLIGMYQLAPQQPPVELAHFSDLLSVDLDDDQALGMQPIRQHLPQLNSSCEAAALLSVRRRSDSGYSASTRSPCGSSSGGSSYCDFHSPREAPPVIQLPPPPPPPPPLRSLWQTEEEPEAPADAPVNGAANGGAAACRRAGYHSKFRVGKIRKPKSRQLQLWEFLYQLLHDTQADSEPALVWDNRPEGVFRIVRPAALAEAWGRHRCRASMTYEKMSRTLRYYYEKQLITKVTGRQHTYRFHYDRFPQ